MTGRRWALVLLGVVGVMWALGGEWINIRHGIQENHFLDAMVGLSYMAAGIVALDRRPGNAIGKLMIAYAAMWFLANWGNLAVPVLPVLGLIANDTSTVFLGHIALAYPSARGAGGRGEACDLCEGRIPDHSDRSSPIPRRSQLGSPDGSQARPAALGAPR